jgi:hypothetical protein
LFNSEDEQFLSHFIKQAINIHYDRPSSLSLFVGLFGLSLATALFGLTAGLCSKAFIPLISPLFSFLAIGYL